MTTATLTATPDNALLSGDKTILENTVTLQDAIEITTRLSPADQLYLVAALTERLGRELSQPQAVARVEIPHAAAVEHAIAMYRQETVTLARAAEIAGITRWELARILQTRGTPVTVEVPSPVEMDRDLAAYLE